MASVVTEGGGRRLIQLSPGEHPKRPKIRLGKVSKREAATTLVHVEALCRNQRTGASYPPATAEGLVFLPDALRQRLERVGLLGPQTQRECPKLAQWLATYIDGRTDVKGSTATVYGHTRRNLLAHFGGAKRLDEITPGDADAFRIHLKTDEGLADNTVRRRLGIAKQFFRGAVRQNLIEANPFDGQSTTVRDNPRRFYFVSRDEAQAVLDACPDAEWRLIFALCRYGGLRCPSEVVRLRWEDVNWEQMRFIVHAGKTEHHADAGIRQVPIFPELYPFLQDCFEQAAPGSQYVITRYRERNENFRTQMMKIIKRAGLRPWPKVFQNLRSSRETELAEQYPVQVVCAWIGNSPQVAAKHYLQVTDEHYEKAVQNPVQQAHATACRGMQPEDTENEEGQTCSDVQPDAASCKSFITNSLGRTGLEPVTLRV